MAIRNLATLVYKLGGGKESIDAIWPINGMERETIAPISKERWEQIKQKQLAIDKSIQDVRLKVRNKR